jgi:hypothetical protein
MDSIKEFNDSKLNISCRCNGTVKCVNRFSATLEAVGDEQKKSCSSASGGVSASCVTQIYDACSLCVNRSVYSNAICDGQFPFSQQKFKLFYRLFHKISDR